MDRTEVESRAKGKEKKFLYITLRYNKEFRR